MFSKSYAESLLQMYLVKREGSRLTLRVERDCAVLELVEGRIVVFVYSEELLLETLQLVLVLRIRAD